VLPFWTLICVIQMTTEVDVCGTDKSALSICLRDRLPVLPKYMSSTLSSLTHPLRI
jgi:hypothetical protein